MLWDNSTCGEICLIGGLLPGTAQIPFCRLRWPRESTRRTRYRARIRVKTGISETSSTSCQVGPAVAERVNGLALLVNEDFGLDGIRAEHPRAPAVRKTPGRAIRGPVSRWAYLFNFACSALTSSVVISPSVVTLPSMIFQSRKGPVISPNLSKETGPMTPS